MIIKGTLDNYLAKFLSGHFQYMQVVYYFLSFKIQSQTFIFISFIHYIIWEAVLYT